MLWLDMRELDSRNCEQDSSSRLLGVHTEVAVIALRRRW